MGYAFSQMPRPAPLPMQRQDFRTAPTPHATRWPSIKDRLWRLAAFAPAVATTLSLTIAIARWLAHGGVTLIEGSIVVLVALTFIWVSLSVSMVTIGAIRVALRPGFNRYSRSRGPSQNVALVVPIYNEVPSDVFGNAAAMLHDLGQGPQNDRFTLFVLSDTRDDQIAAQEERAFWSLRDDQDAGSVPVYYRRRAENTDKKVGNLTDWIETWGGDYDAMLVLDADSLMSGSAIRHLAHELAANPEAGLIQSFPGLIGATTLFGRMQQFSNAIYGWLLAEGLATWSQREGNYWGHNAIIRVSAFAESAHLPRLRRRGREGDLILSHDFVEAGLLRRAGWGVHFLPRNSASFEETPQSLIDYALRDRRWCQGNLQHLRLLTARGFHPMSRFHLLQGAVAFLMAPAWFALIVIWSLAGAQNEQVAIYFNPSNPLFPMWPDQMPVSGMAYLMFIYGMLLFPKILGVLSLGLRRQTRRDYHGWPLFMGSALFEIVCSILYAPVMMVQQSIAVLRALIGRKSRWTPQNRTAAGYGWGQTLRFHWLETVLGAASIYGISVGAISVWLLPISLSLVCAPALSMLSAVRVSDLRLGFARLDAPQDVREPRIVARARKERARIAAQLDVPQTISVAAE